MADTLHGFIYGRSRRMILPCVLKIEDKAHWVFFIVNGGSPLTYISSQVAKVFKLDTTNDDDPWDAVIAGHRHSVHMSPTDSHFANINILGGDFCYNMRLQPWVEDEGLGVTYYFGKKWSAPKLLAQKPS